jgi:hypothetical protein
MFRVENANAESAHTCQVYRELVTRLHAGPDGSNLDCCFYEPPNPDDDKLTAINEPMYQQDPGVFASSCSEQEGCIARVRLRAALAGAPPLRMALGHLPRTLHTRIAIQPVPRSTRRCKRIWILLVGRQI